VRHLIAAVRDRVAQRGVGRRRVELEAEAAAPPLLGPRAHRCPRGERLLERALAPRRGLARHPLLAHDLHGRVVRVEVPRLDEPRRELLELREVVRGVGHRLVLEAEARNVGEDRVDVLILLLRGVGVVEAEEEAPGVAPRDLLVQERGLGVADVEVARGLGREAGDHLAHLRAGEVDVVRARLARGLGRGRARGRGRRRRPLLRTVRLEERGIGRARGEVVEPARRVRRRLAQLGPVRRGRELAPRGGVSERGRGAGHEGARGEVVVERGDGGFEARAGLEVRGGKLERRVGLARGERAGRVERGGGGGRRDAREVAQHARQAGELGAAGEWGKE
jgi:hypothetical protein